MVSRQPIAVNATRRTPRKATMARKLKATDPKEAKPSRPKILVFGPPGVGKTWASLDFPSVYYADCEGGANLKHYTDKLVKSGGVYLGPEGGANDFSVLLDEVVTLATTEHHYRTLVIDSYSKLFNTQVAIDHLRMEQAGRDMEKTFGAEKKNAINYTRRLIRWFESLDMNVIMICHERSLWKDGKEIGQTFDGWDKLAYELHLNLQISKQGASRKAKVVKTRLEGFADGELFDWSYNEFADRFGRDIIEAAAVAVELASEEQVERYRELMGIVTIEEKVRDKWEENGDSPADMTAQDLQKRIDWLEAKLTAANKKGK